MPRSKTVREGFGFEGKAIIQKARPDSDSRPDGIRIRTSYSGGLSYAADLSIKGARELFTAGLQMCDELEGKS